MNLAITPIFNPGPNARTLYVKNAKAAPPLTIGVSCVSQIDVSVIAIGSH